MQAVCSSSGSELYPILNLFSDIRALHTCQDVELLMSTKNNPAGVQPSSEEDSLRLTVELSSFSASLC